MPLNHLFAVGLLQTGNSAQITNGLQISVIGCLVVLLPIMILCFISFTRQAQIVVCGSSSLIRLFKHINCRSIRLALLTFYVVALVSATLWTSCDCPIAPNHFSLSRIHTSRGGFFRAQIVRLLSCRSYICIASIASLC